MEKLRNEKGQKRGDGGGKYFTQFEDKYTGIAV
jgi:hypothetical protein